MCCQFGRKAASYKVNFYDHLVTVTSNFGGFLPSPLALCVLLPPTIQRWGAARALELD